MEGCPSCQHRTCDATHPMTGDSKARAGSKQECALRGACGRRQAGWGRRQAAGSQAVLTPASDFWMFSLALAMSRRIPLAPFPCRQCTHTGFPCAGIFFFNSKTKAPKDPQRTRGQRRGQRSMAASGRWPWRGRPSTPKAGRGSFPEPAAGSPSSLTHGQHGLTWRGAPSAGPFMRS